MSHDFPEQSSEVSDKMLLGLVQLRGYVKDLAKRNKRKFVLKSTPEYDSTIFGNPEQILEKILPMFEVAEYPGYFVFAPKNWRDQIDAQFNISKIKSLQNSKIRKDGRERS